jgi:hypothetical protein
MRGKSALGSGRSGAQMKNIGINPTNYAESRQNEGNRGINPIKYAKSRRDE